MLANDINAFEKWQARTTLADRLYVHEQPLPERRDHPRVSGVLKGTEDVTYKVLRSQEVRP